MKLAIVHDYIKEYGGAEGVLYQLHTMFPDAPIYTSVYLPEFLGPHKAKFEGVDIRTSVLQYLPFKHKMIGLFVMISPIIFRLFNLSDYTFIITSATGAYFPNFINKHKAKLVCYCHTPPRWLYGYTSARNWDRGLLRLLATPLKILGRVLDKTAAKNVDYYIANSTEVGQRIKRVYGRDSVVINPPVEMCPTHFIGTKSDYFLTGGRLARNKRFDVAVKAFTQLNLPLKVYGKSFAGYETELKKLAGNTIEFLGEISQDNKWQLMAGAKAFIFCSKDEDFGITPVEAMSAGTPVIAYKSGGVMETVVDGKTGVFYTDLAPQSLVTAIEKARNKTIKPNDCINQAKRFSVNAFKDKIMRVYNDLTNARTS